jgi:hypothetical protein
MDRVEIDPDGVYARSDDIVAREIEGEVIIVPLVAGIGDLEDALFTFNETGKAVWDKIDGVHPLPAIVAELADEFGADADVVGADVVGLVAELVERGIVVAR